MKNKKTIAMLLTLSALSLIVGATLPTFYIDAFVGAFFLLTSSMLLLFSAFALYKQ